MKIKLTCGFEVEIDKDIVNDYRFIRIYKRLARAKDDMEASFCYDDLLEYMFGQDQTDSLIDYLAESEGRVTSEAIDGALTEVFDKLSEEDEDVKK